MRVLFPRLPEAVADRIWSLVRPVHPAAAAVAGAVGRCARCAGTVWTRRGCRTCRAEPDCAGDIFCLGF